MQLRQVAIFRFFAQIPVIFITYSCRLTCHFSHLFKCYLVKYPIDAPAASTTPLCLHLSNTVTIISIEHFTVSSERISVPISQAISQET